MNSINYIHLIDDSEVDRYMAKRILNKLYPSVEVVEYEWGEAFIETIDKHIGEGDVDYLNDSLVIMDLAMPGMGGIECLREIGARMSSGTVNFGKSKCFVLTSSCSPQDMEDVDQYDFVMSFLNKPLTPDSLSILGEPK